MEKNKSILVCDDSILARKQIIDAAAEADDSIEFIQAVNGAEAVESYKSHKPDLVFIDIVMPVMGGVDAIADIIAIDPDACIIVVSSIGTKTELTAAIQAGAKDFIQKPFAKDHIQEIINQYLK